MTIEIPQRVVKAANNAEMLHDATGVRYNGKSYFQGHVINVAAIAFGLHESFTLVGLLHDVFEDTPSKFEDWAHVLNDAEFVALGMLTDESSDELGRKERKRRMNLRFTATAAHLPAPGHKRHNLEASALLIALYVKAADRMVNYFTAKVDKTEYVARVLAEHDDFKAMMEFCLLHLAETEANKEVCASVSAMVNTVTTDDDETYQRVMNVTQNYRRQLRTAQMKLYAEQLKELKR